MFNCYYADRLSNESALNSYMNIEVSTFQIQTLEGLLLVIARVYCI